MTITEFLEARIAENERAVVVAREFATNQMFGRASAPSISISDSDGTRLWSTDQLLAECAAKRAIIAGIIPERDPQAGHPDYDPLWVIRELAAVYADHPDYQREWAL